MSPRRDGSYRTPSTGLCAAAGEAAEQADLSSDLETNLCLQNLRLTQWSDLIANCDLFVYASESPFLFVFFPQIVLPMLGESNSLIEASGPPNAF